MKNIKKNGQQGAGAMAKSRKLEWWESITPGERKLICNLMELLRGAKQSQLQDVAKAAAEWERGIGCFIKVRLMNGCSATGKKKLKQKHVSITIEPYAGGNN